MTVKPPEPEVEREGALIVHECNEYGTVPIPLSEVLGESGVLDLDESVQGYFQVYLKKNALELRATGYVGLLPINDRVAVRVNPRVPIKSLTEVAHLSSIDLTLLPGLRRYDHHDSWNELLVDHYADILMREVRRILDSGLLRTYRQRRETTSFPHGRINMTDTVARHRARNVLHRVETSYFERTADNDANRCVKYAIWFLAREIQGNVPQTKTQGRAKANRLRSLNALYGNLDAVQLDRSRAFLDDAFVTGRSELPPDRQVYRQALDLSRLVAKQQGLRLEKTSARTDIRLPSLVVHMPDVFEAFLRNVLARFANENAWPVSVHDGKDERAGRQLYAERNEPKATPDMVVVPHDPAAPSLPVEVKYIPKSGLPERPGVNQAVTYAHVYGVDRVLLVQPCDLGEASSLTRVGTVGTTSVHLYRFDLNAADLQIEVSAFGAAVRSVMPPSSGGHAVTS